METTQLEKNWIHFAKKFLQSLEVVWVKHLMEDENTFWMSSNVVNI